MVIPYFLHVLFITLALVVHSHFFRSQVKAHSVSYPLSPSHILSSTRVLEDRIQLFQAQTSKLRKNKDTPKKSDHGQGEKDQVGLLANVFDHGWSDFGDCEIEELQ